MILLLMGLMSNEKLQVNNVNTGKSGSNFLFKDPLFLKENCFLEGSQISPVCPSGKSNIWGRMSMKQWWNDIDRENPTYSDRNLSPCHFFHCKFHMERPEIEAGTPRF